MRRLKLALAGSLVAVLTPVALGAPASAAGTTYAFRLVGPNTALATVFDEHHQPGDYIRVTGSGTFDPAAGTVTGSGAFTHYNADGTVHMRGTWAATGFTSWTPFGATKGGKQGGVLWITTAHFDENGNPCDCMGSGAIPMSMTSALNAPEGTVPGTTVGPFTQPTGGTVAFSMLT